MNTILARILSTAILISIIISTVPDTHAHHYYPPRIQQLCNDNFIGSDPVKALRYEKRCRNLWTAWSNEIKSTLPNY